MTRQQQDGEVVPGSQVSPGPPTYYLPDTTRSADLYEFVAWFEGLKGGGKIGGADNSSISVLDVRISVEHALRQMRALHYAEGDTMLAVRGEEQAECCARCLKTQMDDSRELCLGKRG